MTALRFSPGSAEALKWLALVLMTLDHVNTFVWHGAYPALYAAGRVAFPLFALVLASNLSRPDADLGKVGLRLAIVGAIAAVPLSMLGHAMPFNVMFTFAAAVILIACFRRGWWALACGLSLPFGAYVDYQWPGLFLIVSAWWLFRAGTPTAAWLTFVGVLSLAWPNGNWWAVWALPLAFGAEMLAPHVPRLRWAFYAYYPAHLAVLALLVAGVGAAHG